MSTSTPHRIRSPRSDRAEREFGLVVGGLLVALGSWWIFRHRFGLLGPGFAGLGTLLLAGALLWPRALALPRRAWMGLAEAMGAVMTRLVLGIVFFAVVTPIGVVKRLFGWDPLERRAAPRTSYWHPYAARQRDPKHFEKMF